MPRDPIKIFLSILLLWTTFGYTKELVISEDELIVRGILSDEYEAYESSYQIYKKLFDYTGAEVYLFKEAASALMGRQHVIETIHRLKEWDKGHPDRLEVRRLLIPLYLTVRQVKSATREATLLIEQSSDPIDLDLASNSFLYAGDMRRAVELLQKLYDRVPEEEVLFRIVMIMDMYTNQRKKAIQLLESHSRMNDASKGLYERLLVLYQKERNLNGILETYKRLYAKTQEEKYLLKLIDVYVYQQNMDGAIAFLEQHKGHRAILYDLYKAKKAFDKALGLVDQLYREEKDAKWIAEKGVLTFEQAKDKNDPKVIKEVLGYFEKAFALGNDDSLYLNYYGYTLIDKNVDISKGMQIVQDALVQQPKNTYYLDSLAWGYYKQKECHKAYELMKQVVDREGLEEPEIKAHWDAIQLCQ